MPSPKINRFAAGALALLAGVASADDLAGKPNVVFVLTDDLSYNLVQFMPNVQQLMKDGMSFTNYFVTDSLCCPSRSSIFTGRFPHNTGVFTNGGDDGGYQTFFNNGNANESYSVILKKNGYKTAMMGKYLNGYDPKTNESAPGWDRWVVTGNGYPEYNYTLNDNGALEPHGDKDSDYLTDVLNAKGVDFINQNKNGPFQIEIATFAPHAPYTPARQDLSKFPNLQYPHGPAFNAAVKNAPLWLAGFQPLNAANITSIDNIYRKRAQAVQAVDRMIGDLRTALKNNGIANKTYFIFSSDNGYHMGQWRLSPGKQTPYTTDINVPLVVVGPGVQAGAENHLIVQNTDLCPTFADLAGGSTPNADGASLLPLLHGNTPESWRTTALIEHHGPNKLNTGAEDDDPDMVMVHEASNFANPPNYEALRGTDFVYVDYYVVGEYEYRNLTTDPYELNNNYADLTADRKQALADQLAKLKACKGGACKP